MEDSELRQAADALLQKLQQAQVVPSGGTDREEEDIQLMELMELSKMPQPECVASTGSLYRSPVRDPTIAREVGAGASNHFKSAQWSPDGTCIMTNSADNHLRTFVLPTDLLTEPTIHALAPYASLHQQVYAYAPHPLFSLSDLSSTLVLSSHRDLPLRLYNALAFDAGMVASYPHVNPLTEEYILTHSLVWTSSGTHFMTGSEHQLSVFDISRDGEGPVTRHFAGSSKYKAKNALGGMRGIVSALDISCEGYLAAGTFARNIALFGDEGREECFSCFSVAGFSDKDEKISGTGITQVKWSPCGRYLYVAERKSNGVLVYDIRVAGKRLGWLAGRKSNTNQRMGIDVIATAEGHEVWAGGIDGKVRVWSNPTDVDGEQRPGFEWQAHEDLGNLTKLSDIQLER
ncbi:hypothetical protein H2199_001902 [Coniosporium tulheliwenetii]|uniref:Uncharacterized protein n=1 Tax=Coniosporium tulheliwenetii TaxID=3383036 RepID=A0ACC2ZKQ0_9PEZI|nr:hypothetical protein H2199_001902 [Cladosporium sp. JES 115]